MFYLAKIVKSCQNAKLYSIDNVKIAGFVNCVLQQENLGKLSTMSGRLSTYSVN